MPSQCLTLTDIIQADRSNNKELSRQTQNAEMLRAVQEVAGYARFQAEFWAMIACAAIHICDMRFASLCLAVQHWADMNGVIMPSVI